MSTHKQTVTFTRPQADYLKAESDRLGISVADLVRRIIDVYREVTTPRSRGVLKRDDDTLAHITELDKRHPTSGLLARYTAGDDEVRMAPLPNGKILIMIGRDFEFEFMPEVDVESNHLSNP